MTSSKRFEVHEHTFISGPRANGMFIRERQRTTSTFSHSHEGGDVPHTHADTGPAVYTIDADQWFRETGMRGGSKKKFTAKPTGEQMLAIKRTDAENTFDVVVGKPYDGQTGHGPGLALPLRMIHTFGLKARVRSA